MSIGSASQPERLRRWCGSCRCQSSLGCRGVPSRPKRACLVAGCLGYAVTGNTCETHRKLKARDDQRRRMADEPGRAMYNTTRWRKLREALLARYPACAVCRIGSATEIDHIVRHKGNRELFWSLRNLQPICRRCHIAKTVEERRAD